MNLFLKIQPLTKYSFPNSFQYLFLVGTQGSLSRFSTFSQYFSRICFLGIFSWWLNLEGSSLLCLQLRRWAGWGGVAAVPLLWAGKVQLSRAAGTQCYISHGVTPVSVTVSLAPSSLSRNISPVYSLYFITFKIKFSSVCYTGVSQSPNSTKTFFIIQHRE